MKIRICLVLLVTINSILSFGQSQKVVKSENTDSIVSVADFREFAETAGLQFSMPADYTETQVRENNDLWYGFAIKDKTADFEVRYSIWSLKPALEEHEKCKKDPNCIMVSPNAIYKGRVEANVLNMTSGEDWEIIQFPPEAVKEEFNADKGGACFFEFNCDFGKGYKYGQMIYLHKDNVADVIITYLSNDQETHSDLMDKSFHSLKFR